MSETLDLRIPIGKNTAKKIVALAALTGKTLPEVKDLIAETLIDTDEFDLYVSAQLTSALRGMDGGNPKASSTRLRSFADIEQESQSSIEEEPVPVVDEIAGHALSHDEDTGAPSLEEQIEQDLRAQPAKPQAPPRAALPAQAQDADFLPPEIDVPDVGANTEAFLDTALEAEQPPPRRATKQINSYGRGTGATRSFNPQKRQARVSDYTGGEDGDIL